MLTKLKTSETPRPGHKKPSRFESTKEWAEMEAAIKKGLKPETKPGKDDADALQLTLTPKELGAIGLTSPRTVVRFLQKYLRDRGLNYRVRGFPHLGVYYVLVEGEKAGAPRAPRRTLKT
jgi:hypothetical protein